MADEPIQPVEEDFTTSMPRSRRALSPSDLVEQQQRSQKLMLLVLRLMFMVMLVTVTVLTIASKEDQSLEEFQFARVDRKSVV